MSFQLYLTLIFYDRNALNYANIIESLHPSVGMFSLRHACVFLDCDALNYANIIESLHPSVKH